MPNLLFYNQKGHGEYYRVNGLGSMALLNKADDYRKTWTTIVHLQSGPDSTAQSVVGDVLFYDRQAGRADVYRFDDLHVPRHLRTSTTFSKAWQHITPVFFDGHTNVVFYDADGFAEIWRYVDYGEFVHLKTVTGLPPAADAVVAGNFGGKRGGVLIYDREAGQGRIYRLDEETGALTLVRTHGFAKTWTHIVPVPFGFRTDLFFYSPAGVAEVYRLDADGQMEQISRYLDLAKTWQHIVAFERDADSTRPFLYFYNVAGTAQLYTIDGLGALQFVSSQDDLSANWSQIVPVHERTAPPELRIRVRALVTGENNGPTFVPGFTSSTIRNLVNETNEIYREAGIRLDFDSAEDIQEVNASLLNRDFSVGSDNKPITDLDERGWPLYVEGRARMDLGERLRGRLLVIIRDHLGGGRSFDPGYASEAQEFIALNKGAGAPLAHELGHYLHLLHTFGGLDDLSLADAQRLIKDWVQSQPDAQTAIKNGTPIPQHIVDRGLVEALDRDRSYFNKLINQTMSILDTPVDVGDKIFTDSGHPSTHNEPVAITVTFVAKKNGQPQTHTYSYDPDRNNVMTYLGSTARPRFSPGQVKIMRDALTTGNRRHLTAAN